MSYVPGLPALLVMDVDSTLIRQEVIDLLAEAAGVGARVAEVTERAMRGELDFAQSLAERVSLLAGLPASVIDQVRSQVQLTEGAERLIEAVHTGGGRVGVVSGGFIEVVGPLAEQLGIEAAHANRLEIIDGHLTGRTLGPVVDRAAKAEHLRAMAERWQVPLDRVAAIGDGANDLDMLAVAGLGIAFCAKPLTAAAADARIDQPRLDLALDLFG